MQNKAYLQRRIRQLRREVDAIERSFFAPFESSLSGERWALERKKGHLIRSVVLDLHLSIEDLLTLAIGSQLTPRRWRSNATMRAQLTPELHELLLSDRGIGFPAKLALARSLRIVTAVTAERLRRLNTLRNRCSHNWQLNVISRRNIKRAKPKKHLLSYEGKSLYRADTVERFMREFTTIYLRLYLKVKVA